MSFYKAAVRLEGEVNRNWTLYYPDRVEKFYSIEGSAQRDGDDEFVFEYDPELNKLLESLSCDYHAALENQVLEFEVNFSNGLETCTITHDEFI